jgi:hypothetical protein
MARVLPFDLFRSLAPLRRPQTDHEPGTRNGHAVRKPGTSYKSICPHRAIANPVGKDSRPQSFTKNSVNSSARPLRKIAGSERQRLIDLLVEAPDSVISKLQPALAEVLGKTQQKQSGGYDVNVLARTCRQPRRKNGKLKLPTLPKGLRWPEKQYGAEHRATGIQIVAFLEREWQRLVDRGYGELRWLRLVDPSAAKAVSNYRRWRAESRQELPPHIYFLVEREVTDRKLAFGLRAVEIDAKLPQALVGRHRRGIPLIPS